MAFDWPRTARAIEPWGVRLVALHSAAVGVALAFAPVWSSQFGGFGPLSTTFFTRQAGAFHFVAAAVYLGEYHYYRNLRLMLATKSIAVVFLTTVWLAGEDAWCVPLSAFADGLMAAVAALVHRGASSPRPASS